MSATPLPDEIRATLQQLILSYERVIAQLSELIDENAQLHTVVRELQQFVHHDYSDALTGRNVWRSAADAHKAQALRLQAQLDMYLSANPPHQS